jgi:hypothetical protein
MYYAGATPPRPDPGHLLSVVAGVSKRVAIETPKPDGKLLKEFKRFVWLWLKKDSGLTPLSDQQVYTFEEWLERTPYSKTRKIELEQLWNDCGRVATKKQLKTVKSFVKDETYDLYKFCRGIYSRSDHAKCLFGPYVASVGDQVFHLPWFIKTIPVVDRPEAIYQELFVEGKQDYVFTDYTAYESHFTPKLQAACENQLFKYMFSQVGKTHRDVLDKMAQVKGGKQNIVFKGFNASQNGGRMSGEMDTSLSNGFANLMLYLFASFKAGCPIDNVSGFVEGDDGIFRNRGPAPTEALFRKLGMTIKIGVTHELTTASFCGQVYDVEEGVVVTDIREAVCRFGWTNKFYVNATPKVRLELLRAKGFSFVYQYGRCPVLGALGSAILRLTQGVEVRQSIEEQMDEWERERYREARRYLGKHGDVVGSPGPNTRALVEKLYGVTTSEQEAIEKSLEAMTSLGPLPFQFYEVPKEWTQYHNDYVSDRTDSPPVWVPTDSRKLLSQLCALGALTTQQAYCLRGALE